MGLIGGAFAGFFARLMDVQATGMSITVIPGIFAVLEFADYSLHFDLCDRVWNCLCADLDVWFQRKS